MEDPGKEIEKYYLGLRRGYSRADFLKKLAEEGPKKAATITISFSSLPGIEFKGENRLLMKFFDWLLKRQRHHLEKIRYIAKDRKKRRK